MKETFVDTDLRSLYKRVIKCPLCERTFGTDSNRKNIICYHCTRKSQAEGLQKKKQKMGLGTFQHFQE